MLNTQLSFSGHQLINKYFEDARREVARLTHQPPESIDLSKPIHYEDFPPQTRKAIEEVYQRVQLQLSQMLNFAVNQAWYSATQKQEQYKAVRLTDEERQVINNSNLQALTEFKNRKIEGLTLSQRVWKYTGQDKAMMELALQRVLSEKKSYQETQHLFTKYLNAPEELLKHITQQGDAQETAKALEVLKPGQGVYKDPIKNIQRMLRTEINTATKTADWEYMQRNPYIIGYTISRNKREKQLACEVCDKWQGEYPKEFKFVGWHPQCECVVRPIFADPSEQRKIRQAIKEGKDPKEIKASTRVSRLPQAVQEFIKGTYKDGKIISDLPPILKEALAPLDAYSNRGAR